MSSACSLLQLFSAGCLGVFAGAAVAEAFLLVPWWRSLAAADFLAWYAANDRRLLAFFKPLTIVTAVVTVAAAALSVWTSDPGRWAQVAACVLTLAAVVMFPVYFEAANAKFSAGTLAAHELEAELARWQAWHHVRTVISLAAFGCALVAGRSA